MKTFAGMPTHEYRFPFYTGRGKTHAIVQGYVPACGWTDSICDPLADKNRKVVWSAFSRRSQSCSACVRELLGRLTPDSRYSIDRFMERVRVRAYEAIGQRLPDVTLSSLKTVFNVAKYDAIATVHFLGRDGYTFSSETVDFDEAVGPLATLKDAETFYLCEAFDRCADLTGIAIGMEIVSNHATGYVNPDLDAIA